MNTTEQDERNWIAQVQQMIDAAMSRIDDNIIDFAEQLRENKEYLYENKAEMDNFERYGMRMAITRGARSGEIAVEQKKKLLKLRISPFFGRIDFKETKPVKSKEALSIYIGTHSFIDSSTR
jgi:DNA helicase-2/ATP-dependent DNA helicase PcrA